MKQFLITVAGVVAGLFLFAIVAPIVIISMIASAAGDRPTAPSNAVLLIDLRVPMTDQPGLSPLAFGEPSTLEFVQKLEAAAEDRKVKGALVRANIAGMPPAQAEEVRAALAAFRASGKFVVAHLQPDLLTTSLPGYSAIAAADEIWIQPGSYFGPTGMALESEFLGGAFQKFGVQSQFGKREEFKGGADALTEEAFTAPVRANLTGLLESVTDAFVRSIASDRRLEIERVRALIAETPFPAEAAVKARLADQLGYPEDAERSALERAGGEGELLDIAAYSPAEREGGPKIAVVTGEGAIMSGPVERSVFGGVEGMNSDEVAAAIDEAAADEDVRAIVFRVNSPGGAVLASDQILAAVSRAKESGKKVVVSMGPTAASGGYWVSSLADEIVAWPTTLTGSIGIYGGKIAIGDALERYTGVTTDAISVGSPLVRMDSPTRPFTNAEQAFVSRFLDDGYAAFLRRVSEGRKLTAAQLEEVAGGRVWSGAQARELGLVDHLGGLSTAIERAKALSGIEAAEEVDLELFPGRRSPIEELQDLLGVSADAARTAIVLGRVLGDERVNAIIEATVAQEQKPAARVEAPLIAVQ